MSSKILTGRHRQVGGVAGHDFHNTDLEVIRLIKIKSSQWGDKSLIHLKNCRREIPDNKCSIMVIRSWKQPFDKGRPSSRHTNSPGLPGANFTLDLSLLGQSD